MVDILNIKATTGWILPNFKTKSKGAGMKHVVALNEDYLRWKLTSKHKKRNISSIMGQILSEF